MELQIEDKALTKCVKASKEGGKIANSLINDLDPKKKDNGTVVTRADRKAEKKIRSVLSNRDEPILGEELDKKDSKSGDYWVVDPIDGTRNYSRGFPLFGTSVCLVRDNEPYIASIYLPQLDEIVYAKDGGGVYSNESEITTSSRKKDINIAVTGYGAPNAHKVANKITPWVHRLHTAAYATITVANGVNEALISSKLYPWDLAPGVLFVREAGGKALSIDEESDLWVDMMHGDLILWNGENKVYNKIISECSDGFDNSI